MVATRCLDVWSAYRRMMATNARAGIAVMVCVGCALISMPTQAALTVRLRDPAPERVAKYNPAKLSAAQVRDAILAGGAVHGWKLKSEDVGTLVLVLDKADKQVEVSVSYSSSEYRLSYIDSSNMGFALIQPPEPGMPPLPVATAPARIPIAGLDTAMLGTDRGAVIGWKYGQWIETLTKTVNAYLAGTRAEQ